LKIVETFCQDQDQDWVSTPIPRLYFFSPRTTSLANCPVSELVELNHCR